jgi:hypothetical protein
VIGAIASSGCRTALANCADCNHSQKLETGNWKLETGNWKLETEFQVKRTRTERVFVDGRRSEALLAFWSESEIGKALFLSEARKPETLPIDRRKLRKQKVSVTPSRPKLGSRVCVIGRLGGVRAS